MFKGVQLLKLDMVDGTSQLWHTPASIGNGITLGFTRWMWVKGNRGTMSKHSAGLAENTKTILDFQRSGWNPIGLGLETARKAASTVAPSFAPWRRGRI